MYTYGAMACTMGLHRVDQTKAELVRVLTVCRVVVGSQAAALATKVTPAIGIRIFRTYSQRLPKTTSPKVCRVSR
jgi:hypothetical protein